MKILIVEDELYLAQSICNKLSDRGYECEYAATTKEAIKNNDYDVVLLSTNISGQNFMPVIHHYRDAIIILMVSYINNDTVSIPLREGAKDYILKPFMIEELLRKIEHFTEYERLKKENLTLVRYTAFTLGKGGAPELSKKEKLPILVKAHYQINADAYAFALAKSKGLPLRLIFLTEPDARTALVNCDPKSITYLIGFETLKKGEKDEILALAASRNVVISTLNPQEHSPFAEVEFKSDHPVYEYDDILDLDNYIKTIILNYQDKYPDTELSKKLGISRKSLWEKRKKYDLFKRK